MFQSGMPSFQSGTFTFQIGDQNLMLKPIPKIWVSLEDLDCEEYFLSFEIKKLKKCSRFECYRSRLEN